MLAIFWNTGTHQGEDGGLLLRICFYPFRLVRADFVVSGDYQVKMGSAGGLIGGINHLSVPDHGDTGSAAADIHHRSIRDLQHEGSGRRFIDQSGHP